MVRCGMVWYGMAEEIKFINFLNLQIMQNIYIKDLVNDIYEGQAYPLIPDFKTDYGRLIRRLIHEYEIPFTKVGGRIVLSDEAVGEFWSIFHQVICQGRRPEEVYI